MLNFGGVPETNIQSKPREKINGTGVDEVIQLLGELGLFSGCVYKFAVSFKECKLNVNPLPSLKLT